MNRIKVLTSIFCLSLAALTFSATAKADAWDKKTILTFSQPVEVPGVVLPSGTYVFKLLDSASNRHIVRISNEDQTHTYATVLAIPNYRLQVRGKTVITFMERASGEPPAIRAWFYPGDNYGQEFVYKKSRSLEVAKLTTSTVQTTPSELESETPKPTKVLIEEPAEPEVAVTQPQDTAVKPAEKEVEIAQAAEQPPITPTPTPQAEPTATPERTEKLPQTASQLPFLGLIGLLSLGAGLALVAFSKRRKLAE